jgi:hypothetical protein
MLLAGLVPLLRGGDLAGVWAWMGMAFWPCMLLIWRYRKQFGQVSLSKNTANQWFLMLPESYQTSSSNYPDNLSQIETVRKPDSSANRSNDFNI